MAPGSTKLGTDLVSHQQSEGGRCSRSVRSGDLGPAGKSTTGSVNTAHQLGVSYVSKSGSGHGLRWATEPLTVLVDQLTYAEQHCWTG